MQENRKMTVYISDSVHIKVCLAALVKRTFSFPTSQVGMVQELERRGARVACTYTGGLDFSVPVQETVVLFETKFGH